MSAPNLRLVATNDDKQLISQLLNEVSFYRSDRARVAAESRRMFNRGLNTGLWIGCVAGMWISVAFAAVWSALS